MNRPLRLVKQNKKSEIDRDGKSMNIRGENDISAGGAYAHLRRISYVSFERHIDKEMEGM